jgi:anti-sigma regulatory factor (Ser/Thr protein kinase)
MNLIPELLQSATFHFKELHEAQALADFLGQACPKSRLTTLGLSEIFINAIEHGNLGITSEEKASLQKENNWIAEIQRRLTLPEHKDKFVSVAFSRGETEIRIITTDQGQGFAWQYSEVAQNSLNQAMHGRGIAIAKELAFERLEFSEKGNEVTCIISLIYTQSE